MKKPAYTFKTTPFKHQLEWFLDKRDAEFEALLDDMGCIEGKAIVSFNRARRGFKMTLRDAYIRFNNLDPRGHCGWDPKFDTYARSLCDGEFRLQKIKAILYKGIKPVLRITLESGKSIRLTRDHELLTPDGWLEANKLKLNDVVLTNGRFQHRDGYIYIHDIQYKNHPRYSTSGITEHLLVMEKKLGHPVPDGYHIHHIDGNKINNDPDNLQLVTQSEHHRLHAKHKNFGNFTHWSGNEVVIIPKEDRVISIKSGGMTSVYDIMMEGPHHNFVANQIVVHNCGKTKSVLDKAGYLYKTNKIQGLLLISPKATYRNHVEVAIPDHFPDEIPRMTECWKSPLLVRQKKNIELMMDERRPGLRILSFNTDGIRWNSKGFKLAMEFCKKFKVLTCVDEASDFKSPSGLRSKALLGYRGKPGLKHYSDYRMIMDGTPVTEGPCDFYVPLMFLHEKITGIPSYVAFRAKYEKVYAPFLKKDLTPLLKENSDLIPQMIGMRLHGYLKRHDLERIGLINRYPDPKTSEEIKTFNEFIKYILSIVNKTAILTDSKNGNKSFRNLDDLKTRIAPYVTRRLISDCIDMPTLQELTVNYEMTTDQRKLYKTLEEELRVEMANGDLINTEHAMTLRGRLHEILGGFYTTDKFEKKPISGKNPKLELLFETLGHISDQYKIVIWAHFTWEVEMLVAEISNRLGEETVVQYNGPESEARLRDDPKVRYFVGNQASGSIGLNLQTANYMFFYSRNYKARHEVQAPRRIWRAGQKNNCYIYDLVCNGSVEDEKLFPSLKNKKSVAEEIV